MRKYAIHAILTYFQDDRLTIESHERAHRYFPRSFSSIDEYRNDEQELLVEGCPKEGANQLASYRKRAPSRIEGIGKATYVEVESRRVE